MPDSIALVTERTREVDYEINAPSGRYEVALSFYNHDDDITITCKNSGKELPLWACDIDALIVALKLVRDRYAAHWGESAITDLCKKPTPTPPPSEG